MFTLRCTQRLLKRMNARLDASPLAPTTALGDWYANLVPVGRQQVVIFCAEKTFLPVVVPARDSDLLVKRLRTMLLEMFVIMDISSLSLDAEFDAMDDFVVGKTESKVALGMLTDYARTLQFGRGEMDFLAASMDLAQTPVKPLAYESPLVATKAALAGVAALPSMAVRTPRLLSSRTKEDGTMMKKTTKKKTATQNAKAAAKPKTTGPACELCGKRGKVYQTECCGRWVCDDEANYVMFSYAQNSCDRNHRRYTLCGSHFNEGHDGKWQDCQKCRDGFEPEMVAWYGTNEFNFEKMTNPPAFEPTKCANCKRRIHLGTGAYTMKGKEYFCERCFHVAMAR